MVPKHCHNRGLEPANGWPLLAQRPSLYVPEAALVALSCPGCGGLAGARQAARGENGPSEELAEVEQQV